ncbi:transmembrane protein 272-like [Mobula birostris]|uniref:transmembrane protein 272-like n=1 Tax=Mobula birostris TaxID=1983395 RepID=UPI003B27FE34
MESESNLYTPLLQTIQERPVSPAVTVCLKLLTFPMAIASIVIGTIYLHSCTKQYLIPIYLIVSGSFTLFFVITTLKSCGSREEDSMEVARKSGTVWRTLGLIFSFVWFICGNVWIYGSYEPEYTDKLSPNYCDKTLYLFAFWTTNCAYIALGLTLVSGFCGLLLMCIMGRSILLNPRRGE